MTFRPGNKAQWAADGEPAEISWTNYDGSRVMVKGYSAMFFASDFKAADAPSSVPMEGNRDDRPLQKSRAAKQ